MTQVHLEINIGLQQIRNTSKYIPKLQLYQHSLLTRKVFSRHNFHHWYSSLDLLVIYISNSSFLQVIFIFMPASSRSRSSLELDYHHWIILDLEHHWIILDLGHHQIILNLKHHHYIYIITRSRSLSLDLDHHWIWIITARSSSQVLSYYSSCHRNFYRANPFSCWLQAKPPCRSSLTEPSFFHVGCTTLPLQGHPLQSQSFFILDATPCLLEGFPLQSQSFFILDSSPCLLQGFPLQSQSFFILDATHCLL